MDELQDLQEGQVKKDEEVKPKKGQKPKKPFYKRTWFWAVVAVIVLILIPALSGGSGNGAQTAATNATKEKTEKEKTTAPNDSPAGGNEAEATTPESIAKAAVYKAFGEKNNIDGGDTLVALRFEQESGLLYISVMANDNLSKKFIRDGIYDNTLKFLAELKDNKDIKNVKIDIQFPMTDAYGNSSIQAIMKLEFSEETRSKINYDNRLSVDVPTIADSYWQSHALD